MTIVTALAALLAALILTGPAQAQAEIATDVVFLIDGSGSIDGTDWEIQKAGIALAIEDEQRFPSDTAITVIQWSSTPRLELDRWVLESSDQRTAAADQIRALSQLGGGTSPHVGINAALAAFEATMDPALNQVMCLSTDGTPSSPSALASSAQAAEDAAFDRLSVVAIEDPPFFDANDAQASYGGVVFGGGSVTIARSAVEFANLVGAACLNPELDLVALETNQAIQTWNNDIPLLQGKETVVRAFVETTDGATVDTPGQLFGTRDGVVLPGSPLAAANPDAQVEAGPDVALRRQEREASLNFELPDDWTVGTVDLRLALPGGVDCAAALPDNDCEVQVDFEASQDVTIRAVPITYPDAAGDDQTPSRFVLGQQVRRVDSLYPVAEAVPDFGAEQVFATQPTVYDITDLLARERAAECALGPCDDAEFWYGVALGDAPSIDGRTTFGVADAIPSTVSSGYTHAGSHVADATGYYRNLVGHEVGHSVGLHHAVNRTDRFGFLWLRTRTLGLCNEVGGGDAPLFTDFNTITLTDGTTEERPTLGPIGDDESEVWGFDSRYARGPDDHLAVSDPSVTMPLMSYCRNDNAGQGKWISDFNYDNLRTAIDSLGGGDGGDGAGGSWDAMFVNGLIDMETGDVDFGDVETLPSGRVDFASSGPVTLEVFGRDGSLLDERTFDPSVLVGETLPGEPERVLARFNVPVPRPSAPIGRIEVSHDGQLLGSRTASPTAPTVTVDHPTGGVVLDTEEVTIRWTSGDADGDALTSNVYYSPDGTTWRALAKDLDGSSLTVPRNQLAASDVGRIAVTVTDGVNGGHDISDFFIVEPNAPQIEIVSPADGATYSGVQNIALKVVATDREDGTLTDAAVAWTSDLDGALGTGASLDVLASSLSEGRHVLTATATDSTGLTASASVVIDVERIATSDDAPRQLLEQFADELRTDGGSTALSAEEELTAVLGDEYWLSDSVLTPTLGEDVFKAMRQAAKLLEDDPATAQECCEVLVDVARALATEAVASAADLRPQDADKVERKLEAAEAYAAHSTPSSAIDEFRKTWKVAQ